MALTFRTSCALARTPGCDRLMVVTRSCETAPLFIFLCDLGLAKMASVPHGSERASQQRSESTGHKRLGVKSWSNSALMTMLGGERSMVWFL